MIDMSPFIAARSDQLNADDLMDSPRTITITKVTAQPDAAEQPVSIHYEGDGGKPLKPCKTVRRILVGVWGKDASKYVGRSMTLYRDEKVAFGGLQVGGIRVSHMSHIDEKKTVALQVTRGRKAPFTVLPLPTERPAAAASQGDPAAKWATGFIAKLAEFTTADALEAFAAQKAVKLGELANARPDLHANVTAALAARKAELALATSGFDDDDLTGAEKSPAEISVEGFIARLDAAADLAALQGIVAEAEPHKTFLPDELAVKLEVAADRNRQRLEPATEGAK
jgi:hypothetical protein